MKLGKNVYNVEFNISNYTNQALKKNYTNK